MENHGEGLLEVEDDDVSSWTRVARKIKGKRREDPPLIREPVSSGSGEKGDNSKFKNPIGLVGNLAI